MAAPVKSGSLYNNGTGYSSTVDVTCASIAADTQVFVLVAGSFGGTFTCSSTNLTFTKIGEVVNNSSGAPNSVAIFSAPNSSALTNEVITATRAGGPSDFIVAVQAYTDCQDYTSLVANTDFGRLQVSIDDSNVTTALNGNITTLEADSLILGVYAAYGVATTAITNTTKTLTTTINSEFGAIERSDQPLSAGTYPVGVTMASGSNWRGGTLIAIEILGVTSGATNYSLTCETGSYTYSGVDAALTYTNNAQYPTVVQRGSARTTTTNTTSHAITIPAHQAGDMILVHFAVDGAPTVTDGSGTWNKLGQASNTTVVTGAIFWKIATSNSETLTLTTSTEQSSHTVLVIRPDSGNTLSIEGASANGSSSNSNPPSLTPSVGSKDFLWIATRAGDSTVVATVAPTDFTQLQTLAAAGTGGASTNTAEREFTGTTLDPGTFTSASEQWVSWTLAVWQVSITPTNYTLDCATGSYTYTGQAADLLQAFHYKLTCEAGAYTVTGQDATLTYTEGPTNYSLTCEAGAYTLSGVDATLTYTPEAANYSLTCETGSYTYSGISASLLYSRTLALETGAYSYTAYAATLDYSAGGTNYSLTCESGAYTYTGQAAGLVQTINYQLACETGSYTYTGNDAQFTIESTVNYSLTCEAGNYTLSGSDAQLTYGRNLALETGEYTITGNDLASQYDRKLRLDQGSYNITGFAATLDYSQGATNYSLTCERGIYTLNANDASFTYIAGATNYSLDCATGVYILSGVNADLKHQRNLKLACEAGSYTYTAFDATFNYERRLLLETGSYSFDGQPAYFIWENGREEYTLLCATGHYSWEGNNTRGLFGVDVLVQTQATADQIATAVWDKAIESGLSAEEILRIMASVLAGKVSGAGTGTETFLGLDGTTPRVISTVDNNGNRTNVTVNGT